MRDINRPKKIVSVTVTNQQQNQQQELPTQFKEEINPAKIIENLKIRQRNANAEQAELL
jgi:hypothetical protein